MKINLKKPDIIRLAKIVEEETGNQIPEKKFSILESRIWRHLNRLGIKTIKEYWDYFHVHERLERDFLISLMTTHHTYFFRESTQFDSLQNWIDEESSRLKERFLKTKKPVRVWSAACSRGQEVYSLAMFLEFNLFKKYQIPFEVIGTDIDLESINHAKNGVYMLPEVNVVPRLYLTSCWRRGVGPIENFVAVHPSLRAKTSFETLNLFNIADWKYANNFDIIFCRNVFIYFSEEGVRKVTSALVKKLEQGGMLATGISEPLRLTELEAVGPSCYKKRIVNEEKRNYAANVIDLKSIDLKVHKPEQYRVLCVDDSLTIQQIIKKIFSSDPLCVGVDIAKNGQEARNKLNISKYDVITLDIHMPEVDGIEFLEKLYNKKSDPPVIMISSVSREDLDLASRSMSLGAFDYVEKPALNGLQKSTEELLNKTKMALKFAKDTALQNLPLSYESSISRKTTIHRPDDCVRLMIASSRSKEKLRKIIKGLENEFNSPAILVFWGQPASAANFESELKLWTKKPVTAYDTQMPQLKVNSIYFTIGSSNPCLLPNLNAQFLSLQILEALDINPWFFKNRRNIQVLIDEDLSDYCKTFQRQSGIRASDIVPATSFATISNEFFAQIRKVMAA